MRGIAKKCAPIHVVVHHPQTAKGKRELAKRVASVHADAVIHKIKKLNCPVTQKMQLLDAVIQSASKKKENEQTL